MWSSAPARRRCSAAGSCRCRRCTWPRPRRSRSGRTAPPAGRRARRRPARRRAAPPARRRRPRRRSGSPAASRAGRRWRRAARRPSQGVQVHQHGAAGVGDVGDVHAAVEPPVRFQISQLSMVPNSISPRSARSRRPGDVVEQPADLRAGEVGGQRQAGCASRKRSWPASRPSSRHQVRRCGCPARRSRCAPARRCARSHSTVVSRWLVMPSAAEVAAVDAGLGERLGDDRPGRWSRSRRRRARPSPGLGKICSVLPLVDRDDRGRRGRRRCSGSRWCPGRSRRCSVLPSRSDSSPRDRPQVAGDGPAASRT